MFFDKKDEGIDANRRVAKGSDVHVMTCAFVIVSGDALFIEIEPRDEAS